MNAHPSPQQGRFVTFEGIEGAGKTTLMEGMAEELKRQGFRVLVTREPGGTGIGELLRRILSGEYASSPLDPEAELLLYLADRAQHVRELLAPELAKGTQILCDRYHDSTLAYQGYGRGLPVAEIARHLSFTTWLKPHRTYLLDLPVEVGLERIKARLQPLSRMEQEALEFHARVREGYRQLAAAEPERFVILDARLSREALLKEALAHYPFP